MNFYEITVTTDTRFPADGDDPVLAGYLDDRRILGWSRAEFQRWLKARDGSITANDHDEDAIVVTARLTKKEAR